MSVQEEGTLREKLDADLAIALPGLVKDVKKEVTTLMRKSWIGVAYPIKDISINMFMHREYNSYYPENSKMTMVMLCDELNKDPFFKGFVFTVNNAIQWTFMITATKD